MESRRQAAKQDMADIEKAEQQLQTAQGAYERVTAQLKEEIAVFEQTKVREKKRREIEQRF